MEEYGTMHVCERSKNTLIVCICCNPTAHALLVVIAKNQGFVSNGGDNLCRVQRDPSHSHDAVQFCFADNGPPSSIRGQDTFARDKTRGADVIPPQF